ncbi:tetratricopeptide repeat protein [Enhygromyxa salina]|uniref:Tetratricopeptide repeat protein n=1 Tax=Enhygromyxa salina TaxID=215803 RepID=A0A2S9YA83_9BACT|nr:hypothetical protein [Enhygromyxa salina]PRQ02009.1 hypothetical protein ENSA7_56770 [Enhygromyxa salina]
MAFLNNKVRGAHDRQKQALITEATGVGAQVTNIIEIGDDAQAAGAAVGSSVKALFGGRMRVDFVQVFQLQTNGWSHAFVQPFSGLAPLPGEHHGILNGGIASPAILRHDLRSSDFPWDPAAGPQVAQYLAGSPLLRQAIKSLEWEWAMGMGKITIDWAVQVRNVGNLTAHVVMQTGRYGGLTTYAVGFAQWLKLCHALGTCLGQVHAPPQAFVVPASYGEMLHGAARVASPQPDPQPHAQPQAGAVDVRVDMVSTVQDALRPHVGKKVWVGAIPNKQLGNIQKHVLPSHLAHGPIIAAIDLTTFGSAKDAIVVTPTQLVTKEFDDRQIVDLAAIRAVRESDKLVATYVDIEVDRLGAMRIPVGIDLDPVLALMRGVANANARVGPVAAQVSAFVGAGADQLSMQDAQALAQRAQAAMSGGGVHDKINAAAQLLLGGQYQAAIDSYLQIAQAHPEHTGTCYGQIGAGLFFLQQYGRAIEYYQAAKQHGADSAMMDENIAEAQGFCPQ